LFLMISSCWDRPLQEVPHCSLCWTVLQGFVDMTSMFFLLSPRLMLLTTTLGNLVLSPFLAISLLVLLLMLHMTT
jgi:hypothetical protein